MRRISSPPTGYQARIHRLLVRCSGGARWHRVDLIGRRPDLWRRWVTQHTRGTYAPLTMLIGKRVARIMIRALIMRSSLTQARQMAGWVVSEVSGGE